jgi:outer membrane protein assembly factor BamB
MDNRMARRLLLLAAFVFLLISLQPLYGQSAPSALRPDARESQQATKDTATAGSGQVASDEVMARANRQRSGAYHAKGPAQLHELIWKSPQIFTFSIKPTGGLIDIAKFPNGDQFVAFYPPDTTYPGAHFSTPIIANGTVYFSLYLGDGHLIAVDAATGQRKWTYKSGNNRLTELAVADGSIYIGDDAGTFHVLDAATGQEKWQYRIKNYRYALNSPLIADGVVYFTHLNKDNKGEVCALDIQSRQLRWVYQSKMYVSAIAIGPEAVYFGTSAGFLTAVDIKTGQEKWKLKAKIWNPVFVDGTIYSTDGGNLCAVEAETGKLKWRASANGNVRAAMAIADNTIWYCGSYDSVYAVEAQSGREKWKFKTKSFCFSPIVADGIVYVGGEEHLYAVDGQTGAMKWKLDGEKAIISTPAVADDRVYVVHSDGHVYSFR